MIGKLSGILLEKNPPEIVLECHGVGYEVLVPMSTFYQLPAPGNTTSLLTHLIVREDAHVLYGFSSAQERIAFRQLIKISGVGPRTALAILSGLSVADLNHAIAVQDTARIVKVPGIGKKTAERLLLELKGKFAPDLSAGAPGSNTNQQSNDIEQALIALGYSEKDAGLALKKLPQDVDVSEGIKLALKSLAK